MNKAKLFYYLCWIKSSKGTDSIYIYAFKEKQTDENMNELAKNFAKAHSCWDSSENYITFGWYEIKQSELPDNRRDALTKWESICSQFKKIQEKREFLAKVLNCHPFDGSKTI